MHTVTIVTDGNNKKKLDAGFMIMNDIQRGDRQILWNVVFVYVWMSGKVWDYSVCSVSSLRHEQQPGVGGWSMCCSRLSTVKKTPLKTFKS